jgi:hypothetical protein
MGAHVRTAAKWFGIALAGTGYLGAAALFLVRVGDEPALAYAMNVPAAVGWILCAVATVGGHVTYQLATSGRDHTYSDRPRSRPF